jgi:YjjW family glycine radical enzyme activase
VTFAGELLRHPIEISLGSAFLEIAATLTFSAVDGPGNRYVIFLQGCNFDCVACHNPSTIGRCDACGSCVPACPHGALSSSTSGVVVYDAASCDRCRACLVPCPIDSDPAVRLIASAAMVEEVREVAAFLTGITVTGGEPTMQLDGLIGLFSGIKEDPGLSRLTTLVDSNGNLPQRGWERLLPVMDGAMIDLKGASDDLHTRLTKHSNQPVKDSIRFLAENGKLTEVRILVIEGVTDTDAELAGWAEFVTGVDPDVPVRVMGFRHQGTRTPAQEWAETSDAAVERVQLRLADLGLNQVQP